MMKSITPRQKELLSIIYDYIKNTGYPPTLQEMRGQLNVSSNQSVIDLIGKLEKQDLIKKNESSARSIVILPLGYEILEQPQLVPFLGVAHAGSAISPVEISGEWQEVSPDLARLQDEVFVLKISGDSMINAGIDDGDMVLVKTAKEFSSGDIVVADVDGETTVKRFISEDKPPFLYLKPENPNHQIIYFTEAVSMKGKIISILKKGQWIPAN